MKKIVEKIVILKLGLVSAMLFSGVVFGAESVTVDVVMTVQKLSVARLDSGSKSLTVIQGQSAITERMVYKNDGDVNEDFAIKAVKKSGDWNLVSTQPGTDEYRLSALFHHWNLKPTADEFKSDDILTASDNISTDSAFFNDLETHTKDAENKNEQLVADQKGKAVPVNGERSLYVKFDAPSSITSKSGTTQISLTALAAQ